MFWESREREEPLFCYYFQVHSELKWYYPLGSNRSVWKLFVLYWNTWYPLIVHKVIYIKNSYLNIGIMSRVFTNGPKDRGSIPGQVIPKTQKMVLDAAFLTLSIIWYWSKVKWSNQANRVAPSSTPQCSTNWKGSLQVAFANFICFYSLYDIKEMFKWFVLDKIYSLVQKKKKKINI